LTGQAAGDRDKTRGTSMTDDRDTKEPTSAVEHSDRSARRRFLGKVGKVAVTTSAVTLMLSAGAKKGVAGDAGSKGEFNEWH
jgi:hypothetical protein